jgi:hypothetical protein
VLDFDPKCLDAYPPGRFFHPALRRGSPMKVAASTLALLLATATLGDDKKPEAEESIVVTVVGILRTGVVAVVSLEERLRSGATENDKRVDR